MEDVNKNSIRVELSDSNQFWNLKFSKEKIFKISKILLSRITKRLEKEKAAIRVIPNL